MKYIYYILSILFTLSFGSCKDEIPGSDNPNIGGITLTLTSGNMETRTNLTSTAATQNVETVYIALYKGNGDNATFVDAQDFGWSKIETTNPYIKQNTFTFDNLEAGAEYILLAVGLDADSKSTYGFDSETDLKNALNEKTLAEAKATLATNKTSEDIATSELFAGWNTFTYEPDIENKVEVEMKRRVAGVLCYITDIPTTINDGKENKKVQKLRLSLYTGEKPNNQISLCRKEVEKATDGTIKIPDDFGENNPNPNAAQLTPNSEGYLILKEIDLEHLYNSDGSQTGEIFVIPEIKTDTLKVEANSLLLGAYVIPTKATDGKVTLKVELLGEGDEVLATFNAKRDGTSGSESYNIYPNYIYHIGDKPESGSTDGDQPASLLGKELTVVPQEWTTMPEVDVDFPSVPLMATMELVNETGNVYNTDQYIFDCIGMNDETPATFYTVGNRISLDIRPSILKAYWEILIYDVDNPSSNSMLYMKKEGVYTNKYSASETEKNEGVVIPLVMTENLTDAIRTVAIQLNTYDTSGKNIVNMSTIYVKQYNPIKVEGLAFARFNKGAKRNLSTGEVESNGIGYSWGYPPIITNTLIYGISRDDEDDGLANFKYAKDTNYDDKFYDNSAFYVSAYSAFVINDSGVKIYNENSIWYLPAFYEMEKFMERAITNLIECNVNINEKYWTGSTSALYGSWNMFINSDNKIKWDKEDLAGNIGSDRDNEFLIRQARKIE